MGGRLTAFAVVEDAGFHDSTRAQTLCAGLTAGDVRLADRAYTDFSFLDGLRARGVFFVVRQKTNMRLKCVRRPPSTPGVKNRHMRGGEKSQPRRSVHIRPSSVLRTGAPARPAGLRFPP